MKKRITPARNGYGHTGYERMGYGDKGYGDTGYSDTGYERSGYRRSGYDRTSYGRKDRGASGKAVLRSVLTGALVGAGLAVALRLGGKRMAPSGLRGDKPSHEGLESPRLPGILERRATVAGIRMRWLERGAGEAVVLLHGIPTSPELWRKVMPQLRGVRVLAWEMVGFGDSMPEGRGRDISVAQQAEYLVAWLDHLGIEQAILAGHDLGGGVAQIVAVKHPERCAGLFLTNSIAYDSWPVPEVKALRSLSGLVRHLPAPVLALLQANFFLLGHDKLWRTLEALRFHSSRYAQHEAGAAFARQLNALDVRDTLEVAPALSTLEIPARIVWGAADGFQKLHYGERLAQDLGAPLETIRGAKHFTPEDHPLWLAEALNTLIRDVQEGLPERLSEQLEEHYQENDVLGGD